MIALLLMYTLVSLDSAVGGLWPVWFIFSLLLSLHNIEMSTGSEHLVSSVAVSARLNLSSIVFSHSWVICLEIKLSFSFSFSVWLWKNIFWRGKKAIIYGIQKEESWVLLCIWIFVWKDIYFLRKTLNYHWYNKWRIAFYKYCLSWVFNVKNIFL